MRHRVAGRKLGRTTEHRKALLRNLSTALFDKEKITTTLAKAKELRPFAEKLVTLSKRETLHARRQVLKSIHDRSVVSKLFDTLSARYAQRPGGYTRIIKLGPRRGDNAEMAVVELVDSDLAAETAADSGKGKRAKRQAKAAAAQAASKKKTKTKKASASKKTSKKTTKRKTAKAKDADKAAEGAGSGRKAKKTSKKTSKKAAKKSKSRKTRAKSED
jgi:large subunit ribosomal protein L17